MKKQNLSITAKSIKGMLFACSLMLLPTMASAQCPDNNHPHMIDLGLPSGTKWACCNVGADKPEDYGSYYAWGETEEKDYYYWDTYIHCDGTEGTCHDIGTDIAGTQYDAATANWGSPWVMPSLDQVKELLDNCTSEWTTENGVNGYRFTASNGASVFLPAAGFRLVDELYYAGGWGMYWLSSLSVSDADIADGLYLDSGYAGSCESCRCYGQSVRPVVASSSTPSGIAIDETNFPDEKFRNWVLSQDYGSDRVLTDEEIAGVKRLFVDGQNISDLTGIEYFTSLEVLQCTGNVLTSLDVSKNVALIQISCDNNLLTSLDVSSNTALKWLSCSNNQLTVLDVSNNAAIINLDCSSNELTSLVVSNESSQPVIDCYYNKIEGEAMDALIASLPEGPGYLFAIGWNNDKEQNVITKSQVAAAGKKGWYIYSSTSTDDTTFSLYEGSDPEMATVDEGESIDISTDIDANTNLDGNVVGDVYYSISSGDGSYNAAEGCIVVTKPTNDSDISGQDIFGEDFNDHFTGIVFKVAAGTGTVKVEAEATGNMVLKVKIGDGAPTEMELDGKMKASFPYNVSEDTYVYIYAGTKAAGAKGMRKAGGSGELKIYGIEVTSGTDGIDAVTGSKGEKEYSSIYNLNGQRVNEPTKGVFIKNGKKVLVK